MYNKKLKGAVLTTQVLKRIAMTKIKEGKTYSFKVKIKKGNENMTICRRKYCCVTFYPHCVHFVNKEEGNVCLTYFDVYRILRGEAI